VKEKKHQDFSQDTGVQSESKHLRVGKGREGASYRGKGGGAPRWNRGKASGGRKLGQRCKKRGVVKGTVGTFWG